MKRLIYSYEEGYTTAYDEYIVETERSFSIWEDIRQ